MLSIHTLKSAKEASQYYQKDNYYANANGEDNFSLWLGRGAEILMLKGKVEPEQFKQLLEGRLPNGTEMIQRQRGGHHRPGYDLTFSAPKSVSIMGIVAQDKGIIQAHRNAVNKVLTHIEQKYGAVRSKEKGVVRIEKTNNLTFATFEHTDSRALDPNLHTHCILMNFTQREDGQWRSIYGDLLYQDKLLNGMEYRAELAKELMALGYSLVQTSEHGTFELANFDEKIIKQFSKRREQIKSKLEEMGQEGGKAAKVANFVTREAKINVDPAQLQQAWEQELTSCGYTMEKLRDYAKDVQPMAGQFYSKFVSLFSLLAPPQRETFQEILTSQDRHVVVKSEDNQDFYKIMRSLNFYGQHHNYYSIGICGTQDQKARFKSKTGLRNNYTVQRLLAACEAGTYKAADQRQLWIVDPNAKLSIHDAVALQAWAKRHGVRLVSRDNQLSGRSIAEDAVNMICSQLTERNAIFNLGEAKEAVFKLIGLHVSKDEIENAFKNAFQLSQLIKVDENKATTQVMVEMEKACLNWVKAEQGAVEPILSPDVAIKEMVRSPGLTQGQKEAVMLSLTTCDRIIGIQGVAGSGKTTMLKEVNRLSQLSGYRLIALANTAGAKNRILDATAGSGIQAYTTKKFMLEVGKSFKTDPEQAKSLYGQNAIWVLDEASLASTEEMHSLLNLVKNLEARLILTGDVKQLGAIEAGDPWRLLLGSEMKSVSMTENVRFKDPKTVAVMRDLYASRIEEAMEKLSNQAIEIPDRDQRLSAIADLYLKRTKEGKEDVLVVLPRNEDRIAINDKIRDRLKQSDTLQGKEWETKMLLQKDISHVAKNSFYSYQEGDVIRFNFTNKRLSIEAGDYLEVVKTDPNTQALILQKQDGNHVMCSPRSFPDWSGAVEIFQSATRKLMAGDIIRWKKNDDIRKIFNGDVAVVREVSGGIAQVQLKGRDAIEINLNQSHNQHWDHAYASTVFVAQGQDVPFTIGLCQGQHSPKSTTLSSFLVQATRGDNFVMFVDDLKELKKTLAAQPGIKETAMQYLDPEWDKMTMKVEAMTANVTGRAELIPSQKEISR